jgi:uncharacterized protein (TIGR03083 family)
MATLRHDRYLDALIAQSALFADALIGAELRQRVPTCPEWTLQQLVEHVGRVHRQARAIVTRDATAPPDPGELDVVATPEDPGSLGTWLREGAGELGDAMRVAGPETLVWMRGDQRSVGSLARRMAHETAVHRADIELALGREFTLEADLAADAISEWLGLLSSTKAGEVRPEFAALRGEGEILHLHSTDPGLGEAGEWIVRRTPSGPVWEHGHAKGDVAVRGAVVDLLLVLMRRLPPAEAPISVLGDASVLDHWLEHGSSRDTCKG